MTFHSLLHQCRYPTNLWISKFILSIKGNMSKTKSICPILCNTIWQVFYLPHFYNLKCIAIQIPFLLPFMRNNMISSYSLDADNCKVVLSELLFYSWIQSPYQMYKKIIFNLFALHTRFFCNHLAIGKNGNVLQIGFPIFSKAKSLLLGYVTRQHNVNFIMLDGIVMIPQR